MIISSNILQTLIVKHNMDKRSRNLKRKMWLERPEETNFFTEEIWRISWFRNFRGNVEMEQCVCLPMSDWEAREGRSEEEWRDEWGEREGQKTKRSAQRIHIPDLILIWNLWKTQELLNYLALCKGKTMTTTPITKRQTNKQQQKKPHVLPLPTKKN